VRPPGGKREKGGEKKNAEGLLSFDARRGKKSAGERGGGEKRGGVR